jgi:hypothetical protein
MHYNPNKYVIVFLSSDYRHKLKFVIEHLEAMLYAGIYGNQFIISDQAIMEVGYI